MWTGSALSRKYFPQPGYPTCEKRIKIYRVPGPKTSFIKRKKGPYNFVAKIIIGERFLWWVRRDFELWRDCGIKNLRMTEVGCHIESLSLFEHFRHWSQSTKRSARPRPGMYDINKVILSQRFRHLTLTQSRHFRRPQNTRRRTSFFPRDVRLFADLLENNVKFLQRNRGAEFETFQIFIATQFLVIFFLYGSVFASVAFIGDQKNRRVFPQWQQFSQPHNRLFDVFKTVDVGNGKDDKDGIGVWCNCRVFALCLYDVVRHSLLTECDGVLEGFAGFRDVVVVESVG